MNKQQFLSYLEMPASIGREDIDVVQELIEHFPFCQSLYLLRAKALHNYDSIHFNDALHLAAAFASDRKTLYRLIKRSQPLSNAEATENGSIDGLSQEVVFNQPVVEGLNSEAGMEVNDTIVFEDTGGMEAVVEENAKDTSEADQRVEEMLNAMHVEPDQISFDYSIEPEPERDQIEESDTSMPEVPAKQQDLTFERQSGDLQPQTTSPHSFFYWLKQGKQEENQKPAFHLDTTKDIKHKEDDELDKLYRENIFHLGEYEELTKVEVKTIEFKLPGDQKKEDLIEKFIREEPSIRPVYNDLDVNPENKAKRSSEDGGEVISETLAQVYMQQKLYKKALSSYEKLSLKIPEKSAYFAAQIEKIKKLYPEAI